MHYYFIKILLLVFVGSIAGCKARVEENAKISAFEQRTRHGDQVIFSNQWANRLKEDLTATKDNSKHLHRTLMDYLAIVLSGNQDEQAKTQESRIKQKDMLTYSETVFSHLRDVLLKLQEKLKNPQTQIDRGKIIKVNRPEFLGQITKIDHLLRQHGPVAQLELFFQKREQIIRGEIEIVEFGDAKRQVEDITREVGELVDLVDQWISTATFAPRRQPQPTEPEDREEILTFPINECIGGNRTSTTSVIFWENGDWLPTPQNVTCGQRHQSGLSFNQYKKINQIEFYAHPTNFRHRAQVSVSISLDGKEVGSMLINRSGGGRRTSYTFDLNGRYGRDITITTTDQPVWLAYIKVFTVGHSVVRPRPRPGVGHHQPVPEFESHMTTIKPAIKVWQTQTIQVNKVVKDIRFDSIRGKSQVEKVSAIAADKSKIDLPGLQGYSSHRDSKHHEFSPPVYIKELQIRVRGQDWLNQSQFDVYILAADQHGRH